MKHIEDLFQPLRNVHLTEEEKMLLRNQILTRRQRTLFLRKFFYYTKVTTFAGVVVFGLALFISAFQPQDSERNIASLSDAFVTLTRNDQANIAQAETIGRLVEISGVAHVLDKAGNIVPKTDLFAGEMVILQPGAKVIVQVRANTFAQIIGPAKFSLEAVSNGSMTYILNILEGTYVEVSTQQPTETPDQATSSAPVVADKPEHIVIKTKQLEVETNEESDSHFAITQSDKTAEVITSKGEVLVKHLDQEETSEVTVIAGTFATINQEGIALHMPGSVEEVTQLAKTSEDLLIRYERDDNPTKTDSDIQDPAVLEEEATASLLSSIFEDDQIDLSDLQGTQVDQELIKEIEAQLTTERQQVLSAEDLNNLQQALSAGISQHNLDQMLLRKAKGTTNSFVIAYGNLLAQLNRSYTIVGYPQPTITPGLDSLQAGIVVTTNLIDIFQQNYFLPPSLKADLQLIIEGISMIQRVETGTYPEVEDIATLKALLAAPQPEPTDEQPAMSTGTK